MSGNSAFSSRMDCDSITIQIITCLTYKYQIGVTGKNSYPKIFASGFMYLQRSLKPCL